MQAPGRGTIRPPVGIALDADFGNRIDAVLAVAMLNGFATKGEARRIALCSSRCSLKAAQLADIVSGFYGGRPVVGRGGVGLNPEGMIGMPESGLADDAPPIAAMLSGRGADGGPTYNSSITKLRDTAENAVLIRNVLLAQNDANAAIVLAGPASGLVRVLGLYGSRPQVSTKAKLLVMAAGSFAGGPPDPTIKADVAAARKLLTEWPTPLVAVGTEVGAALAYPAASIEKDFAWAPVHPVVDAYRAFKAMPYDAPASALAATLYAVHPDDGYFKVSEPGTIAVLDDGRTQFTPSPGGAHRYLMADPAQSERVVKLYRDMVSAQPPPRPARRGGGA